MQSPREIVDAFLTALNDQDAEALGAVFTEDASFVNVLGMLSTGRRVIVEAHEWAFRGPLAGRVVCLEEITEHALGEDVAVLHVLTRRELGPDAPQAGQPAGTSLMQLVVQRFEDGWLAVAATNVNQVVPPA